MTTERSGRVWDEVRRALGRMVGRVTTHAVPEARAGIAVAVRYSTATELAASFPEGNAAEWQPITNRIADLSPEAQAGGRGSDLASVATVIGMDRALHADDVLTPTIPCVTTEPVVHAALPMSPATAMIQSPAMQFGGNAVISSDVVFGVPSARKLPGTWMLPSKLSVAQASPGRLRLASVRVRENKALMLRLPISRARVPAPHGINPTVAFAGERSLLAAGAGAPEADVAVIGVFPQVPLEAVQKLAVAPDGGALQIWVKPEVVGRARPVSTVTVILGRQRSTGKTLQAVRRDG